MSINDALDRLMNQFKTDLLQVLQPLLSEEKLDLPTKVDAFGTKYWKNTQGQLHREGDKPAIEYANGDKCWFQNGKRHRNGDQPAAECANGDKHWYQNGKLHRNGDQPAIEYASGNKIWYQNGKFTTRAP